MRQLTELDDADWIAKLRISLLFPTTTLALLHELTEVSCWYIDQSILDQANRSYISNWALDPMSP